MKKTIAIVGLIACGSALAADGPSYNHVQLDYVFDTNLEATVPGAGKGESDGDGFDLSGVFSFSEMWFVKGGYESLSYDSFDLDLINVGVGGHSNAYTGGIDVFGIVTFESLEFESSGADASDEGFGIEIGATMPITDALDASISYQYLAIGDVDGGFFHLSGGYTFMPQWSVRLDYIDGEYEDGGFELERDDLSVGIRYSF